MRRFGLLALSAVLLVGLATLVSERAAARQETPGVTVDKANKRVVVECLVAPRKINDDKFKDIYPIEVIASWPFPKGQKAHETVLTFDPKVKPSDVHKALEAIGLKSGAPVKGDTTTKNSGAAVRISVEVPSEGGTKKVAIEKVLTDTKTGKNLPKLEWRFTGSIQKSIDPNEPDKKVYGADLTGTLITIFPVTDETVFQTNLTMKEEKYVKLDTDKKVLPKEGSPVKLIFEVGP